MPGNLRILARLENERQNNQFHPRCSLLSIAILLATYFVINMRVEAKQIGTEWMLVGNQILIGTADKVTGEVKNLETLAKMPSIIAAVREANGRRSAWTPDMITLQDNAWKDQDPTIEILTKEIAGNPTSAYLIDFPERQFTGSRDLHHGCQRFEHRYDRPNQ